MFKVVLATITIVVYRSLQCHSFSWHPHHDVMSSRRHTPKQPWIYAHKAKNNNVNDGADNSISAEREGSMAAATKTLGRVPYGEASRKYRRTVFSHNDWVEHRSSSSRTFRNLQSMFFSGVVRQLRPQVSVVTSIAVLVLVWNWIVTNTTFHPGLILSLPSLPFTLSSPALGLLLVFRTNAAYARWMRGRDAWTRMTRHGMNLVRMASIFSTDVDSVDELSKAVWL